MSTPSWSLRSLFSPVVARLIIFGGHPIDLEGVLTRLESQPIHNAKQLEDRWLAEWTSLETAWEQRATDALSCGHSRTAYVCRSYARACGLGRYLVNTADIDVKRSNYLAFADAHRQALSLSTSPVRELSVDCGSGVKLAAQLYLPQSERPNACVVVFSGLGSCKEEMFPLAHALVERGVAALVPDMPGSGATLFDFGVPCSMANVELAIRGLASSVISHPILADAALGAMGLCMGGGYCFRAAAIDTRYRFAAALFPLFINQVAANSIPQWMRSGPWTQLQIGGKVTDEFIAEMGPSASDSPSIPFLIAHGRHDNWMTLDAASALLDRVSHPQRELLIIENEPVVTGGNATTHAMPVGEQMHWVVPHAADWLSDRARDLMTRVTS